MLIALFFVTAAGVKKLVSPKDATHVSVNLGSLSSGSTPARIESYVVFMLIGVAGFIK